MNRSGQEGTERYKGVQEGTGGYRRVQGGTGGTESTADTKIGFRRVFIGDRDEEHKDQYRQSVKL